MIVLAGAFLRLHDIWRFPVGFHFDEAANLIDISRIGSAFHPLYFQANNGREPLWFYWAALFVNALGASPEAMRLASAFLGVATLPAVYFCFSQLLRKAEGISGSRRIALFTAAGCAFLFMHVNFSRIALRTISLPLVECLAFGLLWLAMRRGRPRLFVAAGLALAACLYTYTAARLLVLSLLLYGLYWLLVRRRVDRPADLLAAAAAFIVGCLPLGIYALTNAASFFQRTAGIALTDRAAIWQNVLAMLKFPVIEGSINGAHNIIGMPLFDWPMRVAFVVGLVILLTRLREPVYVFVLLWIGAVAAASIFSPDAPYYIRLTALIPPMVLIPALALAALPSWLSHIRVSPRLALAPSLAVVVASAGITYDHYFRLWAPSNDTYFWMMQDKVDAAAYLRQMVDAGSRVFLAPLYAQDFTFKALDRGEPIQSFDPAQCWVLPTSRADAVYAFPPYDATQPGLLLRHLPSTALERPVVNSLRQPVLTEVRVPAVDLPRAGAAPRGNFAGEIGLLRADGLPEAPVAPGAAIHLTLVWQSLAPAGGDYIAFIHADDVVHQRRAQQDHMPCGGSFPTSTWLPGDRVFDGYTLSVPKDAPSGTYTVTAGLYQLPGPRNLTLTSGGTELKLGSFQVKVP